jgi:hypothetical protein
MPTRASGGCTLIVPLGGTRRFPATGNTLYRDLSGIQPVDSAPPKADFSGCRAHFCGLRINCSLPSLNERPPNLGSSHACEFPTL